MPHLAITLTNLDYGVVQTLVTFQGLLYYLYQPIASCVNAKHLEVVIYPINCSNTTEVNLFAFAYRLFHETFSSIYGARRLKRNLHDDKCNNRLLYSAYPHSSMAATMLQQWLFMKQSVGTCK